VEVGRWPATWDSMRLATFNVSLNRTIEGELIDDLSEPVYSRYPILRHHLRSFQHFLWKDMPGALLPHDPATRSPPAAR
jgi:hypothetical protein